MHTEMLNGMPRGTDTVNLGWAAWPDRMRNELVGKRGAEKGNRTTCCGNMEIFIFLRTRWPHVNGKAERHDEH